MPPPHPGNGAERRPPTWRSAGSLTISAGAIRRCAIGWSRLGRHPVRALTGSTSARQQFLQSVKCYRPVAVLYRVKESETCQRETVHEEHRVLACRAVAPQDVGLAVAVEVADSHNAPVEVGHRVDGSVAQNRSAVHEPDYVLAGRAVAPQDVGLAVPIEVADPRDAPVEICYPGECNVVRNGSAVHEPDYVFAGRAVAPQDVGLAVPIEVADPRDAPVEIRYPGECNVVRNRGAVHEPDYVFAGRAVAPQDVGRAVSIEVADSRDAPVEIRYPGECSVVRNRGAVHEPDYVLAGRAVAPQDVGLAVTIEIAANDTARSHPECIQVEILLIRKDLQYMLTGRERNAGFGDPSESAPAASHGRDHASGYIDPVDFDVKGAGGREVIALVDRNIVLTARRDVDRVRQPLSGLEIVHDKPGLRVLDDVHVFAGPILTSGVARGVVVVSDAFAAEVEVLGLEASGNSYGSSGIGGGN